MAPIVDDSKSGWGKFINENWAIVSAIATAFIWLISFTRGVDGAIDDMKNFRADAEARIAVCETTCQSIAQSNAVLDDRTKTILEILKRIERAR